VTRLPSRHVRGGSPVDLLAIDPETFRGGVLSDGFADVPLAELLRRLTSGDPGEPARHHRRPADRATRIALVNTTVPIEVAGTAAAFPGMSSLRPLVIVDEERLLDALAGAPNPLDLPGAGTELWIRGTDEDARAALATLPYVPSIVLTTQEVKDIPHIAAVIDTFLVLNVLGLAAALLVLASIVMYLQARQRSQVLAYGLSMRMGMDARGHRRAAAGLIAVPASPRSSGGIAIVAVRLVVPLLARSGGAPVRSPSFRS
jgi:hypothetical protein